MINKKILSSSGHRFIFFISIVCTNPLLAKKREKWTVESLTGSKEDVLNYQISCTCQHAWVEDNEVLKFQMISAKHFIIKNQIKSVFAKYATFTV